MQVPIGRSGVHAVPKTLHSQGLIAPTRTSPHWHAFGSSTRVPGSSKRASASHSASSGRSLRALSLDPAETAPLERVAQLHRLVEHGERTRVAVALDDPRVLVLHLAPSFAQLANEHHGRMQDVDRLERGHDDGLAVVARHEVVRARPDHRGDVAGRDEPVELKAG